MKYIKSKGLLKHKWVHKAELFMGKTTDLEKYAMNTGAYHGELFFEIIDSLIGQFCTKTYYIKLPLLRYSSTKKLKNNLEQIHSKNNIGDKE